MVAVAQRHGIVVLGTIGNEDHLQAGTPEDHTPFSYTAEPVPANGYVCACDLANVNGLGAAILRDARAGKLPWLKYINFGGGHCTHEDGFQHRYDSDDEHVHLSCFSDWATQSIGSYDPFTSGDSMTLDADTIRQLKTELLGGPGGLTNDGLQQWLGDGMDVRSGSPLPAGRANLKALTVKVDALIARPAAVLTPAQLEELAQRVAAIIGGSISAQVGNMISARMKE
jgi:hypothetical protein